MVSLRNLSSYHSGEEDVADHLVQSVIRFAGASYIQCMITYVQEPLEISRRGSMGRHLNGKCVGSGQRKLASFEEVSRVRERLSVGVPTTVVS